MAIKLIGDTVSLGANASDVIALEFDADYTVKHIGFKATGRCKVTRIEHVGVEELLKGTIEVDNLVTKGQIYELPEDLPVKKGGSIVFSLTDISGATNQVTVLLGCVK